MPRLPSVFIGSSSEHREVAGAINALLDRCADTNLWYRDAFPAGLTTIESLVAAADKADFGVFVLTGDDITKSRGDEQASPRDNVLFEYGMFTGKLGRERCVFVCEEGRRIKLPSDLGGVNFDTYRPRDPKDFHASLGPVCTRLEKRIAAHGFRHKLDQAAVQSLQRVHEFCEMIKGNWWECVTPGDAVALGYFRCKPDPTTGLLAVRGRGFDREGKYVCDWQSDALCVRQEEGKVFYYWTGSHLSRPGEPFVGWAEKVFDVLDGNINSGRGSFSDTNLARVGADGTVMKTVLMRRSVDPGDEKAVFGIDQALQKALVLTKLREFV